MKIIVWFTQDLRLADHPALNAALKDGAEVYCVYILDLQNPEGPVGAARWWLHHSLLSLNEQLHSQGGQLILRQGTSAEQVLMLVDELKADAVYMSRAYDPYLAQQQSQLNQQIRTQGKTAKRFAGFLLLEPDSILNKQQKAFQVFTPFYRHCKQLISSAIKPASHSEFTKIASKHIFSDHIEQWNLCPTAPNWAAEFGQYSSPGEPCAQTALRGALELIIEEYAQQRDFPAINGTSRLSAHLHFGEISPRHIIYSCHIIFGAESEKTEPFIRQLFWREFNYYLLHHYPQMRQSAFKPQFNHFPWLQNSQHLHAWQQGLTGYPIVDAGMRQLWRTGWMHNRVRMICASFLTKHLLIHWQQGAHWFWHTLLDADCANNISGWQWVAGCGADAAPYFRIFNPILQGEKFDLNGEYIRTWVPELSLLPNKYIHKPWQTPPALIAQAGIKLGSDYPYPLVQHEQARQQALAAYEVIRYWAAGPT